jgi:putative restriction endonuclease
MDKNLEGSNKASSYIRALDLLDQILKGDPLFGQHDFWSIESIDVVGQLYEYALDAQKKEGSEFLQANIPPSYGRNGYYSAALKSYQEFLVINRYEDHLWEIYRNPKLAPEEVAKRLGEQDVDSAEVLVDDKNIDFKSREGREAVRKVKTRIGQGFFRKMILAQYQTQCCITGLNIPEVLRASHITSWADDPENRLNPANGLCLSATYDAAFDKHLISFDEDYRLILSPSLRVYITNAAFNVYFRSKEGFKIAVPERYFPDSRLLEEHRAITMA